jgi:hypothetical protein
MQCIFLIIMTLAMYLTYRRNGSLIIYWIIGALYLITRIWLIIGHFDMQGADGAFITDMYSLIFTGIVTLLVILTFIVSRFVRATNLRQTTVD